ncbi:MAG: hypothetical protein JOZ19_11645 [Rubrobacter sp.]|nr:hypothetical protein [Rubrobacter sp.]
MIYSQPDRQKLQNVSRNPRVDLNLNSNAQGGDIMRLEGIAEIAEGALRAHEVSNYVEKYRDYIARIGFDLETFAQTYSVPIRITPTRWQIW